MKKQLLTFIETPIFSEDRQSLLSDDEYQAFQTYMLENYHLGDLIQQTGGCQKIRWRLPNNRKGKSSGVRIIYDTLTQKGKLYLLLIYPKNKKDNITQSEKQILKSIIEKIREE